MKRAFFMILSFSLLAAACGEEEVPVRAVYEPVDCSCPETTVGEPLPEAEPEAGADEATESPEPEPVPEPVPEPESESEPKAESQPTDQTEQRSRRAESPTSPAPAPEPQPPPALDPRIDLNTATRAELETLPRIGPSKAQRILDYRAGRPFRRTKDLMRIKGIGPATFRKLEDRVVVRPMEPLLDK